MPTQIECPTCEIPLAWVPEDRDTSVLRTQMQDQHDPHCTGEPVRMPPEDLERFTAHLKPQQPLP
jgi:hypothetical protein